MNSFVRTLLAAVCACALASPFHAVPACAADASGGDRFERTFDASGFRIGQDALKYELSEGGMFKIMPRLANSVVFTRFDVQDGARSFKEWIVTASVYNSESPASGVALWSGDNGHVFCVFPDGGARLQYYEGTKVTWSMESSVKNFSYPAKISIERDPGGSILARVNGVIVGARLFAVDLAKQNLPDITAVSFATRSTKNRAGSPAWYESLNVVASGEVDLLDRLKK